MVKLSFKQQVLTGFVVSLLFVFISALTSYFSIKAFSESSQWVSHSHAVISIAEKTEIELLNAETGLRGYLLTEKGTYKNPYNKSINRIIPSIDQLKKLTSDNPQQTKLADSLEFYALQKVEDMKTIVQKVNSQGFAAAQARAIDSIGQVSKENFLRINNAFIKNEQALLDERKSNNESKSRTTIIVVILSSVVIFGLILFLLRYIRRTFDQQKETEKEILETNKELAEISAQNKHNNWLLSGAAEINEAMRGEQEVDDLANNIISTICNYIDARIGALFLVDDKKQWLYLSGTYAYEGRLKKNIRFGEGLVGQAALEKKTKYIKDVPKDYVKISSALGETVPNYLFLVPIVFEDKTIAVAEMGFLIEPQANKLELIANIAENIGIALNSALAHLQLKQLFEQTQQQAEELASQQEELRTTNEELVYKTEALQASEEELRVQQEELQHANAELEEKAQQLEERNASINQAKEAISLKAQELELSSKYKSEFLANMSHELRTPLNSILILARILKENRPNNLQEEQIKYAGVIHNAGSDLLTLINDILDLSKIESGNIDINLQHADLTEVKHNIESLFSEVANNKKIDFDIQLAANLPQEFTTDQGRLEQIIKNLLSNAFKFTPEKGKIKLDIGLAQNAQFGANSKLKNSANVPLYFAVSDTGIGISKDKQRVIFEAFQQEDGSTSRKYGGTGLGLSISRELASLLGGEIQVDSEPGMGSTFTLYLPQDSVATSSKETKSEPIASPASVQPISESLPNLSIATRSPIEGKHSLLIVEDDENFAEILKAYAIEKGFTPMVAHSGDQGLQMATELLPDAIVLDVMLPVMDGWTILKKLKENPATQHIPVHMMSAGDEKVAKAEKEGAIGFLKKPVEKEKLDHAFELLGQQHAYTFNNVLLVEDQVLQSNTLKEQLIQKGVKVSQAYTGKEAIAILEEQTFDCIILDLKLPDISGFDLLDQIKANPAWTHIPVIINTAMELDKEKMAQIMRYTEAMVLKSQKSNDRLLDEVSLFMNRLQKQGKHDQASLTPQVPGKKRATTLEKALKDKTILITDDDMRNIFALSSALQFYEINIVIANTGVEALKRLEEHPQIDLVLMDIMMPEMDGYEAMRRIRQDKQFEKLPIIALTAKAMKNDREKCIEAGANDYISKPVDVDKLLSMMRVWLS
ncbi:response regulator [Pedobacter sp. KR3-3]|uniref:histidine kinase n=1 Tax=Pedobacter albus TaxID=3113905 RepID=A0ABU7I8S9_9SPHI|nr:response regulator [Pedobacter sp. KR3-3]MEE1945771.1 response regulator [Pedobacter sp. KR3-3]